MTRKLYLLPKAVAHLKSHLKEFHGDVPALDAYVFYSRNAGPRGKMSQMAVSKRLKLHAETAHKSCVEVPLDFHAHHNVSNGELPIFATRRRLIG